MLTTTRIPTNRIVNSRYRIIILLVSLVILLLLSPAIPVSAQSSETHIVQRGETLAGIAAVYGISYQRLAQYNSISDPNRLYAGQVLRIPTNRAAPASPKSEASTTTSFSSRDRTAPPPTRSGQLPQWSSAPPPTATPARAPEAPPDTSSSRSAETVHTVRRGESLYGIAARYGVTVESIMRRNRLRSSVIFVGQALIIPTH
jgi:LysM repeat protein